MDRKSLVAMALCFLIFMGWQKFYIEPRMPKNSDQSQTLRPPGQSTEVKDATLVSGGTRAGRARNEQGKRSRRTETRARPMEIGTAVLADRNQAFVDWKLKGYKLDLAPEAASVDLKSVTNEDGEVE